MSIHLSPSARATVVSWDFPRAAQTSARLMKPLRPSWSKLADRRLLAGARLTGISELDPTAASSAREGQANRRPGWTLGGSRWFIAVPESVRAGPYT